MIPPLDPGPWWRRALCALGIRHRPWQQLRQNYAGPPAAYTIVVYCSKCWRKLG